MKIDLNFCLRRFADEQMLDSIKQIAQLERNLERKHTKIEETAQENAFEQQHIEQQTRAIELLLTLYVNYLYDFQKLVSIK